MPLNMPRPDEMEARERAKVVDAEVQKILKLTDLEKFVNETRGLLKQKMQLTEEQKICLASRGVVFFDKASVTEKEMKAGLNKESLSSFFQERTAVAQLFLLVQDLDIAAFGLHQEKFLSYERATLEEVDQIISSTKIPDRWPTYSEIMRYLWQLSDIQLTSDNQKRYRERIAALDTNLREHAAEARAFVQAETSEGKKKINDSVNDKSKLNYSTLLREYLVKQRMPEAIRFPYYLTQFEGNGMQESIQQDCMNRLISAIKLRQRTSVDQESAYTIIANSSSKKTEKSTEIDSKKKKSEPIVQYETPDGIKWKITPYGPDHAVLRWGPPSLSDEDSPQEHFIAMSELCERIVNGTLDMFISVAKKTVEEDREIVDAFSTHLREIPRPVAKAERNEEDNPRLSFTKEKKDQDYHYVLKAKDGSITEWSLEYFSLLSLIEQDAFIFRCRTTGCESMVLSVPCEEAFRAMKQGDKGMQRLLQQAFVYREKEEKGLKQLEAFNLPQERTGCIRVAQKSYDQVVSNVMASMSALPLAVQQAVGSKAKVDVPPIIFSDDPLVEMRALIKGLYKDGVRSFFLSFFCHGSPRALAFGKTRVDASAIASFMREFPDAKFCIDTIACFGGALHEGMKKELQKSPDLQKQFVGLFTQTKPNISNLSGQSATQYHASLFNALFTGSASTWGKAVAQADVDAKQQGTDANSLIVVPGKSKEQPNELLEITMNALPASSPRESA